MKTIILAAALAITAAVGIAQAQLKSCTTTCTGSGPYRECTTTCY